MNTPSVCVIGPGTRFLSGVTYYTYGLANSLSAGRLTSAILFRRLVPRRWYPGRDRVGDDISHLRLPPRVDRYEGVDWFWFPSILVAAAFLARRKPDVLILQWWTGATLHSSLVLVALARILGTKVVVEVHESQDVGEMSREIARRYVDLCAPWLFRMTERFVVHSEADVEVLHDRFGIDRRRIEVVRLPPFDHYRLGRRLRAAPDTVCNLLWLGVIRPFKGVEDLVDAFDAMDDATAQRYWLTVVGETWEGWTLPAERIEQSPRRSRISFVDRYVTDEEVDAYFGGADVVVLPYHRSSASGPLQVAMSYGIPVVVTAVGGLPEAVAEYEGAVVVDPEDPEALLEGIEKAATLVGSRFVAPTTWKDTVTAYERILDEVAGS